MQKNNTELSLTTSEKVPLDVRFHGNPRVSPCLGSGRGSRAGWGPGRRKGRGGLRSIGVLFGGDGHQLLGSLGNVVGTLDDLLRDQLDVRWRAQVPRDGLPALSLQPVGTGREQAERCPHQLRLGFLKRKETLLLPAAGALPGASHIIKRLP